MTYLKSESTHPMQITNKFSIRVLKLSVIAIIIAASFLGIFDRKSETYVDTSLNQALAVYAGARGMNAIISVAQSFQIPFVTPGEILDPVNDLVERFSTLMELSIGSLVIQKLLIEITAYRYFNYAIAAAGVILGTTIFAFQGRFYLTSLRFFLTLVFLRFSVVLALFFNGVISDIFIIEKIKGETTQMNKVVNETNSLVDSKIPNQLPKEAVKQNDQNFLQKMGSVISERTKQIYESMTAKLDNFNPKIVKEKLEKSIQGILRLMALFFLQTIFLPIIFLYLFKKVLSLIWQTEASSSIPRY